VLTALQQLKSRKQQLQILQVVRVTNKPWSNMAAAAAMGGCLLVIGGWYGLA
jgi:hypothetical protein